MMTSRLYSFVIFLFAGYVSGQETLFSLLNSDQTGVTFANTIVDTPEHNILLYANYYGGGGVGIADINNDGLQDLYFTGNLVGDQLYLNLGGLKFKNITMQAGIIDDNTWSSGVAMADVNADGFVDIYVSKELYDFEPERRKNKLYINQQNGMFVEAAAQWGVDNDARTRQSVFLDYDKDGLVDLFMLIQPPNPGSYSSFFGTPLLLPQYSCRLYKNTGDRFVDVTEQSGLFRTGFPNSVVAADLNEDGWTDLYVANDFNAPDFLYFNNGDGTFSYKTEQSLRHTSFYSMGVDVADINNDGHLDLQVLDMVAEDNFRLKSNMSGMNIGAFWKVVNEGGYYQYMFNTLQLNNGNGTFSDVAQQTHTAATDWSWANLIADFDNDGHKDIFITNGLLRDIRNTDADKKVSEFVVNYSNEYVEKHPNEGDIDLFDILPLDKTLEILPSVPLKNYAYHNLGDLNFENKAEEWGLAQPAFSNGAAYADLENDGDLELVVNNVNEKAFIYQNNTVERNQNNYLRVQLKHPKQENLFDTRVTIYTQGAKQTVTTTSVRGIYSTSEQLVHFGLGNAQLVDSLQIRWPDGSMQRYNNLSANQVHVLNYEKTAPQMAKKDLPLLTDITTRFKPVIVHEENAFDDYEKQVLLPHKLSQFGPALATADINGDGREDFFVGGAQGHFAQLYVQEANGSFSTLENAPWLRHRTLEDVDALFFDADQDGDHDLYVVSGGNEYAPGQSPYLDRLYINDGQGNFTFERDRLPALYNSGSVVKAFDYDGDGDQDLFVGNRITPWNYPEAPDSYLLINEAGRFTLDKKNESVFKQLGMVTDAIWTDFDLDGDVDLIVVGEWMPITFVENNKGKFRKIKAPVALDLKGWWNSVTEADLNQDGKPDYLFGNLGTNYKYKATPDQPFELYYNDFDDNGKKDIVLTYYNYGIQYPLRGFSCSSEQVPVLKTKFKKYDLFAQLNAEQVYGEKQLEEAFHIEATDFRSAVLMSTPSGYAHQPLPTRAQLSSINDFTLLDIDADGVEEVLYVGNLYVSEIETPRNDAGIGGVLRMNKMGAFEVLPVKESGFYTPGDAKKIKPLRVQGQTYLLIANNNDVLQVFTKNQTTGDD